MDLAEVGFIDSSGINALLVHLRHCQLVGGGMTVPHTPSLVRRALKVAGVDDILTRPQKPRERNAP
ncbi:hypothetical protein GCM10010388_26170 [Streptomyces mauvecolor]